MKYLLFVLLFAGCTKQVIHPQESAMQSNQICSETVAGTTDHITITPSLWTYNAPQWEYIYLFKTVNKPKITVSINNIGLPYGNYSCSSIAYSPLLSAIIIYSTVQPTTTVDLKINIIAPYELYFTD